MVTHMKRELRLAGRHLKEFARVHALWNLTVWVLTVLVVAPVSSILLGLGLLRGGEIVIANEEIVSFLVSPAGVAWLLLAGALFVGGSALRYAGLFALVASERRGEAPTLAAAARLVAARAGVVARLAVAAVVVGLLAALPLLSVFWGIYSGFLTEFDINYYLSARPPELTYAVAAGAAATLVWAAAIAVPIGKTLLAVPAYLDGRRSLAGAFRWAWGLSRRSSRRVVATLLAAIVGWLLIRAVADTALVAGASATVSVVASLTGSIRLLVLVGGLSAFVMLVVDTVIAFAGFSFASTFLTGSYFTISSGEENEPASGSASREEKPPERSTAARTPVGVKSEKRARPIPGRPFRGRLRPGILVLGVLLFVAAGFGFSSVMLGNLPDAEEVVVSAHRAGPPPAPENTLSALEQAIEAGADFSEIDVQRTSDGELVVVHDADLMRVARNPRRVTASTYDEIRDVVQLPDDGTPESERRVATLGEFIERARGRIRLMIEPKFYGFDPRLAESVLDEVEGWSVREEVVVMSLNLPAVYQLQRLAPEVERGYVSAVAIGDITRLPVDFLAVNQHTITQRLLANAQARSVEVHAWTVNDRRAMIDLVDRGVDGLITDDPALAVEVRNQLAELTPAERLLLRFGLWVGELHEDVERRVETSDEAKAEPDHEPTDETSRVP